MLLEPFINLKNHFFRTFLAIIGITIGTSAFVALMNLGLLFHQVLEEQFNALGKNAHYINIHYQEQAHEISARDIVNIKHDNVSEIMPLASLSTRLGISEHKAINTNILGINSFDISKLKLNVIYGRNLLPTDQNSCLINESLLKKLQHQGKNFKVGDEIPIDGSFYTIVGITQKQKDSFQSYFIGNVNNQIVIPLNYATKHIEGLKIDKIIINVIDVGEQNNTLGIVQKQILDHYAGVELYSQNMYDIYTASANIGNAYNYFLIIIGAFSLIIGGIGIMNIMMIAVVERQQEIGLRVALGATPKNIWSLFLYESVIICMIGGFIGIMLSIPLTFGFGILLNQTTHFYYTPIIIGIFIPLFIGVIFGVTPAYKASKINPINSLTAN